MYSGGGVWGLGIFIGCNGEVWRGCEKYNLSESAKINVCVFYSAVLPRGTGQWIEFFFFFAVLYINILSNN